MSDGAVAAAVDDDENGTYNAPWFSVTEDADKQEAEADAVAILGKGGSKGVPSVIEFDMR
jgi:hypothetical protein